MKLLITLVLCLCLQAEPAHRYRDSLALWQKKVPKEAAFSLKQFSNEKEMCGEAPCELFYFLAQNPQIANQKHANLTVLLLGGLRGDDTTGPNLLLNAYGQLPAARTVFFPLPNPSGFNQGTLPTHPGGISVEDDLPVGENHECNRTAAVMALHYLYRSYPIDLTIYVHDGKPAIAYSWGKKYQEDSAKAEDFGIYADIADMVRFEGSDQSGLGQIEAGSLFEMAQLGRVGDFVDWAYGASKYPATLSKQCGGKDVAAYPPLMMNGLVLSLGVGKIQATANPLPVAEKQLKRGLLLIEKIVRITSPKAKLEIDSRTIFLTLEGCKTGSVSSIKLLKEGGEPLFQRSGETIVNGDVTYGPPEAKTFPLPKETVIPSGANYQVAFDCGDGWLNIGSTAFSKPRSFTQKGFIINKQQKQQTQTVIAHPEQQQQKQQHQKQEKQQQKTVESKGEIKGEDKSGDVREGESEWGAFQFLGITLLLVGGGWMVNGIRLGLKAQRSQRIKNFNQKFETVEIVEDLESYSEGLDEKETPEQGEHGELKESQQDADKARLRSA